MIMEVPREQPIEAGTPANREALDHLGLAELDAELVAEQPWPRHADFRSPDA
jgi:hypothetical protein